MEVTKVGLLTLEQKNNIQGKFYAHNSYFNPFQDKNNNWVISVEEMEAATVSPYEWVKELPLIDYEPIEQSI